MRGDFDEDEYDADDFDLDGGYCDECGGEGWIVTCVDDICHGLGYCIHGDGMQICGCNDGDKFPSNVPSDWWVPPDGGKS